MNQALVHGIWQFMIFFLGLAHGPFLAIFGLEIQGNIDIHVGLAILGLKFKVT